MMAESMDSILHHPETQPESRLVSPTWPPITWLAVAKAEHVMETTQADRCSQAAHVTLALAVVEDVEKPAIEHGVELQTEINEARGICDDETRLHAPFGCLRLGQLDGPHRHVDAYRFVAA
jgi:hypothetical protein